MNISKFNREINRRLRWN